MFLRSLSVYSARFYCLLSGTDSLFSLNSESADYDFSELEFDLLLLFELLIAIEDSVVYLDDFALFACGIFISFLSLNTFFALLILDSLVSLGLSESELDPERQSEQLQLELFDPPEPELEFEFELEFELPLLDELEFDVV